LGQAQKMGSVPFGSQFRCFAAAGYFLLWNDKVQNFLTVKFDATTQYSLWRIWMVYYGGISLAVATGSYSYFCPPPIKEHATAFGLARDESQYLATMGLSPRYLDDVKTLEAQCTQAERALFPKDRPPDSFIHTSRGTPREAGALTTLLV
jgi:hypothetical protein